MGAVNIFLGGTGKFIAEDIQDARQFYKDQSIGAPVAFDLDAATREGVELDFVSADTPTINGVADLAKEWATRDPGRALGPDEGSSAPGPRTTPEHAPLVGIGSGIAAKPAPNAGLFALRAHGLAVFSMLFDDSKALAGAGPGLTLRTYIDKRVTDAGANPRINIVTSTAGGTGAGMVIPLALWLRQQYPNAQLNLVAVTASAFAGVLKGAPNLNELRAKGLSGTYALLRELSFFHDVDSQARFPERRLPVTREREGLAYSPGNKLFAHIYWFGGRDGGGDPDHAFREAEPLLRVLSDDSAANFLDGKTGDSPLQWVGAATSIEYPKLRLQRRMVSRVLVDSYRSLREPAPAFVAAAASVDKISLLDYVDATVMRPLGAWFHAKRHGAMAPNYQPTSADAGDLLAAVQQAAGPGGYEGVNKGVNILGNNYDSSATEWQTQYVPQVVGGLESAADNNKTNLAQVVARLRQEEEKAFGDWLLDTVYGEWLSAPKEGGGEPRATGDVLKMLASLESEAGALASDFRNPGLFPIKPVAETEKEIGWRKEKLQKPDAPDEKAKFRDRAVALVAALVVGALGWIVARPIAEAIPSFAGGLSQYLPWLAVVVAMIGARWIALDLRLHGRVEAAKGPNVRRAAEEALFDAYRERDRSLALHGLLEELRGEGPAGGRGAFFEALRKDIMEARQEVERLDSIYKALEDTAAAAVAAGVVKPAHVREEVGDCIADGLGMPAQISPEVRRRIAVQSADGGLSLRLRHITGDEGNFKSASEDVAALEGALKPLPDGQISVNEANALNRWKDSIWSLVNHQLGASLPRDFHRALLHCADGGDDRALISLTGKLQNLGTQLPKPPSVTLSVPATKPSYQQVYAGDKAILADLNNALASGALNAEAKAKIGDYQNTAAPDVVPALREQIVFLDLWVDPAGRPWAPHVIGNADEIRLAQETYYAAAGSTTFTVIPELLAATKIEMGAGRVDPIAPAVVARLLGSDLDMQGPTYAELFYLLRHRGRLRTIDKGSGPGARTVTVIGDGDDSDAMPLVSRPVGAVPDAATGDGRPAFGAGRAAVIDFDTFVEFMRHKRQTLMADADIGFSPFPNAEPHVSDWAAAPARVAALQRMAVEEWYAGDVEDDAAAMLAVLDKDVAAMANGEAAVRSSWERAMRRLLAGDERKAIRRTHLLGSQGA